MAVDMRAVRAKKGATQREIATAVNISESYYSLLESNERKPSVPVAKRLGKALGIKWTKFFE